ncbi:hypothetical protein ABB37_07877 [Leptomonas pyrrhocoris]|uniref:Uncharacterized protein n=1 Tax=Leptomonas pyrrhocoris TaxID=157538 RepID=A0A0M9FU69_LEPPY|nr:hypothetical protein ABB37_07877 [Leptomonas pyrrhocoris]KPA76103.1 hypothetical protein ABB37_07877 [Leptomonas pyrrhocoris]|eukprot:XP_015654542.1 hypothetical protein ABB37_07877 [Leptomonas pyrrhocoris]
MSAPSANAEGTLPPTTENVSDIVSAIQRVLEEHHVSDARFVLELPNGPSLVPATGTAAGGHGSSANNSPRARNTNPCSGLEGHAGAAVTTLVDMRVTPAAAPPTLPEHHRPPPRARSASTEPALPHALYPAPPQAGEASRKSPPHQPLSILVSTPTTATSFEHSAHRLDQTSRPPPGTDPIAIPTVKEDGGTPSLMSPLQYSLKSTESPATPMTTDRTDRPSQVAGQADKGEETSSPGPRRAADLANELADLRRLSHEVAQEVAAVDGKTKSKEPLQTFVGRSAILDDRRKRQSASSATSQWSPSNGLPLFPTPLPPGATSPTPSGPAHRSSGPQPPPSLKNGGGAGAAAGSGGGGSSTSTVSLVLSNNIDSLPQPRPPVPARRSVVLVASPLSKVAGASGGGGSSTGSAGSTGNGGGNTTTVTVTVPPAGSLPSLVAVKKSAKPGRTPVFSILNKDGSRLLEGGVGNGGGSSSNTTASAGNVNHTSNTNTGGGGVDVAAQLLTPPRVKGGTGSAASSTGAAAPASHHSRPSNVSLMADDRDPPSPVFKPLVGTAAEEQACQHPSILVQSAQQQQQHTRLPTPPEAPVSAAASTPTPVAASNPTPAVAAATPPSDASSPPLPSLQWTEQSRENTRRALQLQRQSRLSQTTEALRGADGAAVGGSEADPAGMPQRRLVSPALGKAATTSSGSTPAPFPSLPPTSPATFPYSTAPTANNAATASVGSGSSPSTPSRPSLREMLLEQQQLANASRRGMEQHAKLMQAAHTARASLTTTTTPTKPPSSALRPTTTSSAFSMPLRAVNAPATVAAPVYVSHPVLVVPSSEESGGSDARGVGLPATFSTPMGTGSNASTSPRPGTSGGSGIQVMKITLPHDADARQSAVQQLCRSSSGRKYVDSKERYRALLANQKEDLTSKDEKEEKYKDLLSRAVDYNRMQHPQ